MKTELIVLILFSISVTLCNCDKEIDTCSACGVDNPAENLSWLKSGIEDFSASNFQYLMKVDLIEYNANQLITFTWKLMGVYDLPTGAIYNCKGHLLYDCGGNQPFDSCVYILTNSKYIGNIWHK